MRSSIKQILLTGLALSLPLSCVAGTMGEANSYKPWSLTLQGGFFGASEGSNQKIKVLGMDGNKYTVNNNSQISGLGGVGLYFNTAPQERFQLSYGVDAFYLGQVSVKGKIIQEDAYTNFDYKYGVQNVPVYAAAKALIFTNNSAYDVTLDAGIGPNFMWTTGYRETSLVEGLYPAHNFKGISFTTFTATAGIGLRVNNLISQMPVPLECGYRFFYLGKGNLRINNNQNVNTLNTGDAYANALVCSVTV